VAGERGARGHPTHDAEDRAPRTRGRKQTDRTARTQAPTAGGPGQAGEGQLDEAPSTKAAAETDLKGKKHRGHGRDARAERSRQKATGQTARTRERE